MKRSLDGVSGKNTSSEAGSVSRRALGASLAAAFLLGGHDDGERIRAQPLHLALVGTFDLDLRLEPLAEDE